jgi:hypothetical protein
MNHTPIFFPILFGVLMAMVFIWFAMIIALFKRLKSKHPPKYKWCGTGSHILFKKSIDTD